MKREYWARLGALAQELHDIAGWIEVKLKACWRFWHRFPFTNAVGEIRLQVQQQRVHVTWMLRRNVANAVERWKLQYNSILISIPATTQSHWNWFYSFKLSWPCNAFEYMAYNVKCRALWQWSPSIVRLQEFEFALIIRFSHCYAFSSQQRLQSIHS